MTDFDNLYTQLVGHIAKLQNEFIDAFLSKPMVSPDEYEDYVKAYCILSHAAIEEYFENVALKVMIRCLDDWMSQRTYRDSLITLACCYKMEIKIDDDDRNAETKIFDYLRPLFEEAKSNFSRDIKDNNGASVKYLRRLMTPVAIDIKNDVSLLNSLKQLAKERGEYAHKQLIKKILSPEDARNYVQDCLLICDDIKNKANNKFV